MDLIQIKYFLALAKALNFTRAAEACNVTQPALTKSIQRLEHEMGGPLILRERNLTQLTELGRRLLPTLQQTYDAAENARRLAAEFRRQSRAPLRLGVGPDVETSSLLPVIRELGRRLPGFEIVIQAGAMTDVNDWLLHSEIDVGMIAAAEELPERATRWALFNDPVVVVLPRGHELDGQGPVESAVLEGHLCIGHLVADTPLGRLRSSLGGGAGDQAGPRHRGSTGQIVDDLVLAGLGVGLSTERHPLPDGMTRRPVSPPVNLTVSVAVMAGRPRPRAADMFLKLVRARAWN